MSAAIIPLAATVARYLTLKRSLGRRYALEETVLTSLTDFLAARGLSELDQASFEAWSRKHEHLNANVRRNRQRIARNLCLYQRRSEATCFVPDNKLFVRACPHVAPVIFGPVEVARMLGAARELRPWPNSPIRAQVVRLAIVLLYTAGLRRGELLRLTLGDVDSEHGTLRIRASKFHKSRTVPLSFTARNELNAYLSQRRAPRLSDAPHAPLLCNTARGQRAYTATGISAPIKQLYDVAGVRGHDGRRPRVHDFRHSFAVQALLRWYREGVDVQAKLPHLAMYMGHVSIASTAYYLKLIPEVAEMASARFEAHYGHLISGGSA
jgi:integrase/recombinase XerD